MDHYYWFALKSVPAVGNVLFRRLLERFGTPEAALKADPGELAAVKGVSMTLAHTICRHDYRQAAERECCQVRESGCRIVDILAPDYPELLREISDPPPYLYVCGDLSHLDPAVAIVGSRRASSYGLLNTERLAGELASHGVTVISGMARGVDTAAHRGALRQQGMTVGVVGCGLDVVYPPENGPLFNEMKEQGALVSEFPLGTLPLAENFPRRNRLISGMSRGVLVVEAAELSGSLITARFALEQGREVFAIPGNINFQSSRGTNRLIKQGAKLVDTVSDILEELPRGTGRGSAPPSPHPELPSEEKAVFALLARQPLHIDEIISTCALTVGEVSAILLRLEMKGVITQLPGKHFVVT